DHGYKQKHLHVFFNMMLIENCWILLQSTSFENTNLVAPKLFEQMYSIHGSIRGKTLPLLYALLPNETQGTYEELFKIVDQHIQHKPKYVTIDFEKANENALATVFPQCDIFGRVFHFKQCELCLRKEFLENADSRHTMKNLVALAFVPQQNVIQELK
ncbi:unnamed protein product, partial [Didymodactylos carnosus]